MLAVRCFGREDNDPCSDRLCTADALHTWHRHNGGDADLCCFRYKAGNLFLSELWWIQVTMSVKHP